MLAAVHSARLQLGTACLVAGLLLLLAPVLTSARHAVAQSPPLTLTTDTEDYCRQLEELVRRKTQAAHVALPSELAELSSDGRRMCDEGQPRRGIQRLR